MTSNNFFAMLNKHTSGGRVITTPGLPVTAYSPPKMPRMSKINVAYLLLCEYFTIDQRNRGSFINVFNEIRLQDNDAPVALGFYVVAQLIRESGYSLHGKQLAIEIVKPDGTVHKTEIVPGEAVADGAEAFNIVSQFALVEFADKGAYKVRISIDGVPVERTDTQIEVKSSPILATNL
jgi:hypothetical protein